MSSLHDRLAKPEYTGENRCLPCTIVNLAIAVVLGGALWAILSPIVGLAAVGIGLAAIGLRGYIVPGTPTLTKRYFPDRVLAAFDKHPVDANPARTVTGDGTKAGAGAGDGTKAGSEAGAEPSEEEEAAELVDPVEFLLGVGAIEPCEGGDVCLADAFADRWRAETESTIEAIDTDGELPEELRESLRSLYDLDPNAEVRISESMDQPIVYVDGRGLRRWRTEAAMAVDLASYRVLSSWTDRWAEVPFEQRPAILQSFRTFLETCPDCGGAVRMTEDRVESCCRSWEVLAVACERCETRFLEIDPDDVDDVE